jgi:hypothetical protein
MNKTLAKFLLLLALIPSAAIAETKATFTLPSGVKVEIVEAPFEKGHFKVEGCAEQGGKCRINGRVPFGTVFGLPKTYVKRISVSFQGRSYSLNSQDMYDAWGHRPLEYKGVVRYFGGKCYDSENCQFRGLFSDAAGSFVAEWRIVNGESIRTVLTDSDDITNLFMKNIDPPAFE